MKTKRKFKPEAVIQAVQTAAGNIAEVSRMLGCSRPTVYVYARDSADVQCPQEPTT